jgi:hypothetical protein
MSGAIQAAAAEISRLYADIYRWLPERDKSEEGRRQWTEACGRFHHAYPKLAFPGGLARMYAEMPRGHSAVLEDAIRFLETDPYFFRSGCLKGDLLRYLARAPLDAHQEARLRDVVLARIRGPSRREFRRYCRIARRLSTPEFIAQLKEVVETEPGLAARHAEWVLQAISHEGPLPTIHPA